MAVSDTAVQRLLDRVEIEQRKHAYLRAADDGDPVRMVERFTPDCTASYVPGQPVIEGRDTLREWYAQRIGNVVSSSHHLSNLEIDFDGADTAHVRSYLYSWQRYDDFPEHGDRHCWARYIDTWVRTPAGWYQSALVYLLAHEVTTVGTPRCGEYLRSDAWRTGIA